MAWLLTARAASWSASETVGWLNIVNPKSSYDNLAKTSAYYNLNWLKDNLDSKVGNLQTRQHKDYILYLIDSLES